MHMLVHNISIWILNIDILVRMWMTPTRPVTSAMFMTLFKVTRIESTSTSRHFVQQLSCMCPSRSNDNRMISLFSLCNQCKPGPFQLLARIAFLRDSYLWNLFFCGTLEKMWYLMILISCAFTASHITCKSRRLLLIAVLMLYCCGKLILKCS